VKVITHPRARLSGDGAPLSRPTSRSQGVTPIAIIAIGASTGGPGALVQVLRDLPSPCRAAILIVLHLGAPFARDFADWLDGQTPHPVRYAIDGERVSELAGMVRLAPPDLHLALRGSCLRLTGDPERFSCRPSVDVLFESVAAESGAGAMGCLLTGMGRDGAAGLLRMRQAGAVTIAQDEATSVVYGMPREAALLGAARRVLPLGEIGAALADFARGERGVSP
jgi:two-component system chemotaxis response regulator CheB